MSGSGVAVIDKTPRWISCNQSFNHFLEYKWNKNWGYDHYHFYPSHSFFFPIKNGFFGVGAIVQRVGQLLCTWPTQITDMIVSEERHGGLQRMYVSVFLLVLGVFDTSVWLVFPFN